MTTRFDSRFHSLELACFMPISVAKTGGLATGSQCGGNWLVSCYFLNPKRVVEKGYLLRKREKGAAGRPFSSPHVLKATKTAGCTQDAIMDAIRLTLPYPPTVNHYWQTRVVRKGARYVPQVHVSQEGQRYQSAVARHLDGVPRFDGRLRVQVLVQPPDARARDLDNVLKCLLDSLTKAGVWHDDSQVDSLLIVRGDPVGGGSVIVVVAPIRTNAVQSTASS